MQLSCWTTDARRAIRPLDAGGDGRRPRAAGPADQAGRARSARWRSCRSASPGSPERARRRCPSPAAVAVFAGDHGVHAQGVTPWPQEVTAQMVANFLAGGAVVNAFARQVGASVTVVDVGVATRCIGRRRALLDRQGPRAAPGDLTVEPALTRDEASRGDRGRHRGRRRPRRRRARDVPAHRRHGHRQHDAGGRADRRVHRCRPGRRHRPRHRHRRRDARPQGRGGPGRRSPCTGRTRPTRSGVLAAVGGLEHAALAGFMLGAAARAGPGGARRRDRGLGRAGRGGARPGRGRRDGRRAPLRRAGRHRRPARTSASTRWSTWACGSARAPARCSRCRSWRARCGCCTRSPRSTPPGSPEERLADRSK